MVFLDLVTTVESGSDDLDRLDPLSHFLIGQVGLIHKINYVDVTWIFNRLYVLYKTVLASGK